jgi:hypothetical protein
MTIDAADMQRLEAAIHRLPLLPERRAEVDRAVTGLTFVIRSFTSQQEDDLAQERDAASFAAAVEIRDVEWALLDLKEAWDRLSDKAYDSILAHMRRSENKDNNLLKLIEEHDHIVEIIAETADHLEHPDRPAPAPPPDDPALVLAKHAARVFTRLTGKTPPRAKSNERITPGAFYWLLEDILRTAKITASVETYIRKISES